MAITENNSLFTEVTVEQSATVCGGSTLSLLPNLVISLQTPVGTRGNVLVKEVNLVDAGNSLIAQGVNLDQLLDEIKALS